MICFGGRDDDVTYNTDGSTLWSIKLWNDGGTTWTTSNSNTSLQFVGPGVLRFQAGGSNGVQLLRGGTSWSSWSDERMKDIIEYLQ